MRAILLSALLLSSLALVPSALAVDAGCEGWVCDAVRFVCGGPCVSLAETDCSGGVCDTINRICGGCIPAASADATAAPCAASVCEDVNRYVCRPYFHTDCLA